jgi:hypothetical protein
VARAGAGTAESQLRFASDLGFSVQAFLKVRVGLQVRKEVVQ